MNILSIDFDYFQKVKNTSIFCNYPDGIDLPPKVTEITWAGHYFYDKEGLLNVKVDISKLEQIKNIIKQQDKNTKVMVSCSHKDIYKFVMENYKGNKCRLYNIDLHHDFFQGSNSLDCGNWVGYLRNSIKDLDITWIARRYSEELYGEVPFRVKYDFSCLRGKKFDLIFMCRSDSWLPPHLDLDFNRLVETVTFFKNVFCDNRVIIPRDLSIISKITKQQKDLVSNVKF